MRHGDAPRAVEFAGSDGSWHFYAAFSVASSFELFTTQRPPEVLLGMKQPYRAAPYHVARAPAGNVATDAARLVDQILDRLEIRLRIRVVNSPSRVQVA